MSLTVRLRRGAAVFAVASTAVLSSAAVAAAAPQITGISPTSGPAGTTITFSGTELQDVSQVQIQGQTISRGQVVPITSVSATAVTVTAPNWVEDTPRFRVFANSTLVDATVPLTFSYPPAPAPQVTTIAPASAPTSGGTAAFISGKWLLGAISVSFGGAVVTPQITNDGDITVITPPHPAGVVDVTVTTRSGSVTKVGAFTYASPDAPLPVVARVNPQNLLAGIGGFVQIQGTGLSKPKSVRIGTRTVIVLSSSANTIWVAAPGLAKGVYPVSVTGANGTTSAPSGNAVLVYKNLL